MGLLVQLAQVWAATKKPRPKIHNISRPQQRELPPGYVPLDWDRVLRSRGDQR